MSDKKKKQQYSKYTQKAIDREEQQQRTEAETINELETDPRYKEFFKRYQPDSVERFIKSYARDRGRWLQNGEYYLKKEEKHALDIRKVAENCLWEIQQKKLFNAQCLWRAEELEIKEVDTTHDFWYWEAAIKKCSFIEPVTRDEVDLYIRYLHSNDCDIDRRWVSWQDYREYKEAYAKEEEGGIIPEWYMYFDTYKGTGSLMILPDVREGKEDFYADIWREKVFQPKLEKTKKKDPPDPRPYLHSHGDTLDEFMEQFEDKKIIKYRDAIAKGRRIYNSFGVDVAMLMLGNATEKVPIEGNIDWKEAVIKAAQNYKVREVARVLPMVHEDYRMRLETGLPFEEGEQELEQQERQKDSAQIRKDHILEGRKLNGEPEDFDF